MVQASFILSNVPVLNCFLKTLDCTTIMVNTCKVVFLCIQHIHGTHIHNLVLYGFSLYYIRWYN